MKTRKSYERTRTAAWARLMECAMRDTIEHQRDWNERARRVYSERQRPPWSWSLPGVRR